MKRLSLLIASAILAALTASAHHSLAAEYDTAKPISLSGVMTQLDWRNPHAWIYLDAKMADGKTEKWQCELGSPNAMIRAGFSKKSAAVGDEIMLEGVLAKDGSKTCSTRVVKSKEGKILFSQSERDKEK